MVAHADGEMQDAFGPDGVLGRDFGCRKRGVCHGALHCFAGPTQPRGFEKMSHGRSALATGTALATTAHALSRGRWSRGREFALSFNVTGTGDKYHAVLSALYAVGPGISDRVNRSAGRLRFGWRAKRARGH